MSVALTTFGLCANCASRVLRNALAAEGVLTTMTSDVPILRYMMGAACRRARRARPECGVGPTKGSAPMTGKFVGPGGSGSRCRLKKRRRNRWRRKHARMETIKKGSMAKCL